MSSYVFNNDQLKDAINFSVNNTCNIQDDILRMMTNNIQLTQNGNVISATDNQEKIQIEKEQESADQQNQQNQRKIAIIENLVDTTALIIDVIWKKFSLKLNTQVISLRLFIKEVLRRSRTSWTTLETALFYLLRIKLQIAALQPESMTIESTTTINEKGDPATCGRRMFLASLIIASKYLQDCNYSNSAWSKISGLPIQDINAIERRFLNLINYNLFIKDHIFKNWSHYLRLHICPISEMK
ncbi:cyclin-domain-containing protein [Gigaspora rosea]|uniref:Cyclin-domain-containing protein n=1 Tax=Gigaspora rosea TaxID=44941 RepID=A0A397VA16_9GLOM|nr:cyclin-domain-containing protein [Gigaspora rosea]CAG8483496.1 9137_t:CDS:2 [Gigaspora rosea]